MESIIPSPEPRKALFIAGEEMTMASAVLVTPMVIIAKKKPKKTSRSRLNWKKRRKPRKKSKRLKKRQLKPSRLLSSQLLLKQMVRLPLLKMVRLRKNQLQKKHQKRKK